MSLDNLSIEERIKHAALGVISCQKCLRMFGNKGAFARHDKYCKCKPGDREKIKKLYDNGLSSRELDKLFDRRIVKTVLRGKRRTISEALKIENKLHPENHKFTEARRQHSSIKRKEWLSKNRNNHSWRYKGEVYPEKKFREWLTSQNINFVTEYTPEDFDRYFKMDFAILSLKIDIELNGEQHYKRNGEFNDKHIERQKYIELKGWKVINIKSRDVLYKFDDVKNEVLQIIA